MSGRYEAPLEHTYLDGEAGDPHHRLILDNLLAAFGLSASHCVVEIGSGSGRYTAQLAERGLRVLATEPDPLLAKKLAARVGNYKTVEIYPYTAAQCAPLLADADAVCGFHILHHLGRRDIEILGEAMRARASRGRPFKGWFFLEPNPLNPLYPLQITLHPGMRWREEIGIWRNDYRSLRIHAGQTGRLGDIGIFPPRALFGRLPRWAQRWGASLSSWPGPWHIYTIHGEILHG